MRKLKMWYGLFLTQTVRFIKRVVRGLGQQMKVFGRKLVAWGDESTPRWSLELFNKCYLAEAEIHLGGKVFAGRIKTIYQRYTHGKRELVVKISRVKEEPWRPESDELALVDYGSPVIIKEDGYDCVWTGHRHGYLAIFFSRPL